MIRSTGKRSRNKRKVRMTDRSPLGLVILCRGIKEQSVGYYRQSEQECKQ